MTIEPLSRTDERVARLELRVAELEENLRRSPTWLGWTRSVLRWFTTTPPLLLGLLVATESLSASTTLPPGLFLFAAWAMAAVLWAATELFGRGSLRFRVSRLILIVALLGAALGYWRNSIFGPYTAEQACLSGIIGLKGRGHTDPFGPTWLMGLFGPTHFQRVVQLELAGPEADPTQVGRLRGLPYLRCVFLTGPAFDDRSIDGLIALPALQQVYLTDSRVTKEGIGRFREARPDVEITRMGRVIDDPTRIPFP